MLNSSTDRVFLSESLGYPAELPSLLLRYGSYVPSTWSHLWMHAWVLPVLQHQTCPGSGASNQQTGRTDQELNPEAPCKPKQLLLDRHPLLCDPSTQTLLGKMDVLDALMFTWTYCGFDVLSTRSSPAVKWVVATKVESDRTTISPHLRKPKKHMRAAAQIIAPS